MSHPVIFAALVCLPLVIGLGWAAWRPLPEEKSADANEKIEDLLPLHTQHYPQLRQALTSADKRYLDERLSREHERLWDDERGEILRSFVGGLAGDFGRVMRLARLVDSLAPDSARPEGMESSWLALGFRLHYRILSLRISGEGPVMIWQIRQLTARVGSLSALAETAMTRLQMKEEEAELRSNFNA